MRGLQLAPRQETGDAFGEEVTDEREVGFIADLFTGSIGDIEDIDDLVEVSGDFGERDVQAEFAKNSGNDEEESPAVVGEDVDDGAGVGGFVVGDDLRSFLDQDRYGIRDVSAIGHQHFFDRLPTEEHIAGGFGDFGHADGGDRASVIAVDHLESVEDSSVVTGDDLSGEDFKPFGGEDAANFAEAASAVFLAGHDGVFGEIVFAVVSSANDDILLFESSHGDEEFEEIRGRNSAEIVGGERVEDRVDPVFRHALHAGIG